MLRALSLTMAVLVTAGCAVAGNEGGGDTGTGGTGPITFATGRDTTAYLQPLLDRWNQAHPAEKVTLLELPEAADEQRAQMVANLQARSTRYDVLGLDVVWTAEFAENGWIIPLERGFFPLDRFLPPVVETAVYKDKLWAVPYTSNAGLLYYRTDLVKKPPRTWAELREQAQEVTKKHAIGGYGGQFLAYEGLTVNFSEAVQSAGSQVVSPDGTKVTLDVAKAGTALDFLRQGLREGWIPTESLSYKEEESRLAFQEGRLAFARNWPHAYGPARAELGGKVGVTMLPGLDGPGSSTLGGANLAVSASSKHQQTAQEFIRYFTGLDNQRRVLTEGSFPPVWTELYDDPELTRRFPYLPVLKQSILAAKPRPVSANYNQLSLVIASSVSKALSPPYTESARDVAASVKSELEEILRTQ
ncbi:ABC transporter substrate-binding protein [Nonomuraea muscovyensis]|uniref:Multiple sugar transport system substrate-binding protein n=1 Tax=Nonomuraea muscovyensis TaxID=1124761 RepID=A0A7X0F2Z5_9ACTN|nr:ABC transporter substrate-binding protein [Nonomuraea muscovyensis]MBB6351096.1 multiple sugar transport system substrate-binding protein [Nonomuraea muscovyensis]MDF2707804.1 transporter substrate-binding protein [Nonomuraea muscovyensis]